MLINKLSWINNKFYKENYYYIYSMTVYHLLVIFISYFIPYIPVNVLYRLSFSPQATNTITTSFSIMGVLWSVFLIFFILINKKKKC